MEDDKLNGLIDETIAKLDAKILEANEKTVSIKDYESFKAEIKEQLSSKLENVDTSAIEGEIKQIHEKHGELVDILKKQGDNLNKLQSKVPEQKQVEFENLSKKDQFEWLLKNTLASSEFKDFMSKDMHGATPKMDFKAVSASITSDHTGTIFITEPGDNVRDIPRRNAHMRDYISVGQTDEPEFAFPQVTDYTDIYTLGTQMLAENTAITDVTFKSSEVTSSVARLGVSMNVSKRYFRGRSGIIINHVIDQIPDGVMFKEDVQVIFGDGAGNNLSGIVTDAREFDLTPETYIAGAISSVATYDSGTKALITFAAAHGLLAGDKLTIANAAEGTYNAEHTDIILIDETKVVINLTYVAEADTSGWTGTGASYWYQAVDNAQEFDVLSAAQSILEAGLYSANVAFLNPQTIAKIATLKGTDAHYVGVSRDAMGTLTLNGMPVVSFSQIPAGWFLIGDFSAKNVQLLEYTPMSIQFLEDVTTKRENSIVVLADEEIHLVKYNPNWYIFDRFSTAITELETPAS